MITLHDGIALHATITAAGTTAYLVVNCGSTTEAHERNEQTFSDACWLFAHGAAWVLMYRRGRLTFEPEGTVHAPKVATFATFEAALLAACAVMSCRSLV